MEKFYIDRLYGIAIWVYVENGIVVKCENEKEHFITRMHQVYKGKTISFLKEDFEKRMGRYHNVQNDSIVTAKRNVWRIKTEISHLWNLMSGHSISVMSNYKLTKEKKEEIKAKIDELEIKLSEAKKKLHTEKERVFKEHNFMN